MMNVKTSSVQAYDYSGGHRKAPWLLEFIARRLTQLKDAHLTLVLPDGSTLRMGDADGLHGVMIVHHWRALRRIVTGGAMGFAESYMDGDWESPDIESLLELFARNVETKNSFNGSIVHKLSRRLQHLLRANTRKGSRRNIAYHYDLGNEFYRAWLDPSMTYSAALFEQDGDSLEAAQARKYRRLLQDMNPAPDEHILEIGCGWGGFAEMAARDFGCRVTGITLSKEQLAYAEARIARAGLADRVSFRLQDYRDVADTFDHIASIEMFEAVGEAHWPLFFQQAKERVRPGGRIGLQIITINDREFERYRRGADFIQRYIFPGGMLPSPTVLRRQFRAAALAETSCLMFADGYARSLEIWRRAFLKSWLRLEPLGFDARFRRMWEYYLAYCRAGFVSGLIDVGQYVLRRT